MQGGATLRVLINPGWQLNGRNRVLHRYWFSSAEIILKIVLSSQRNGASLQRFMYTRVRLQPREGGVHAVQEGLGFVYL